MKGSASTLPSRDQSGLGALDAFAGEDSAVDVRHGSLRQGIIGVATFQQRRDTSRAQHAVIAAILGDDCLSRLVGRVLRQRHHRVSQVIRARSARLAEECPRRIR